MKKKNFTVVLSTKQTPQKVYEAVQNVKAWWSGFYSEKFKGNYEKLGDEFNFTAGDGAHDTSHRVVELIPGQKIVWLTTKSNLSFLDKKDEWMGTKIIFEISEKDGKTQLTFTHEGLTQQSECYNDCAPAWTQYLNNKLLPLINNNRAVAEKSGQ